MPPKAKLHIVAPQSPPVADTSYEWKHRQTVRERNWGAVHVAADRRQPVFLAIKRFVRR